MRCARVMLVAVASVTTLVGTIGVASATSAANYAQTYCANVQSWRVQLAKDEGAFHNATSADTDLATAKQEVASFLKKQSKGAGAAASALDDAGAPSVRNGDKFNAAMVKNLQAFRDRVGVLADNAAQLSTTDATAFAKSAKSLDAGGFAKALLAYDRATTKAMKTSPKTVVALSKPQACKVL